MQSLIQCFNVAARDIGFEGTMNYSRLKHKLISSDIGKSLKMSSSPFEDTLVYASSTDTFDFVRKAYNLGRQRNAE